MIQSMEEEDLLSLLSTFRCEKDTDIENFLCEQNKAVQFEQLLKARTYLVFDKEQLERGNPENLVILGYISLAQKVLSIPESVSNQFRKKIDGLSAKIHGRQISEFPVYLIGQLGRNSKVSSSDLPGKVLLDYADSVISVAMNAIGGRTTMVECHNKKELIRFYSSNGFQIIGKEPDEFSAEKQQMVQMIRIKFADN